MLEDRWTLSEWGKPSQLIKRGHKCSGLLHLVPYLFLSDKCQRWPVLPEKGVPQYICPRARSAGKRCGARFIDPQNNQAWSLERWFEVLVQTESGVLLLGLKTTLLLHIVPQPYNMGTACHVKPLPHCITVLILYLPHFLIVPQPTALWLQDRN